MLNIQIYTDSNKTQELADYTHRALTPLGGGLEFSSGPHGFEALTLPLVPMSLPEAFGVIDWPVTPWVVVSDRAGFVAWEGRLEDRLIVDEGIQLRAFGGWSAYNDQLYTALWSKTGSGGWRFVTNQDNAAHQSQKFEGDNDNRIYIALKKNEVYTTSAIGGQFFVLPDRGGRNNITISFDYDITLPNSDWGFRTRTYAAAFGATTIEDTVTGNGSQQTGSKSITVTAGRPIVTLSMRFIAGGSYTATAETGDWYIRITNIRVKTTTAAAVLANSIAASLVVFVSAFNPGQASSSTALIEATTRDLQDEIYEDMRPAAILANLASRHGYEVGVWEGQRLHFRPLASAGTNYHVDVTRLSYGTSLNDTYNEAYALYQDANNRALRTTTAQNDAGITESGVRRRGVIRVRTTSATQANAERDALLTAQGDFTTRLLIEFERLQTPGGAIVPLWMLRSGDTITMANLPPTLSADIDKLRTFRVNRVTYNADLDSVEVEPAVPIPTVASLLASAQKR
jgi:hypothetical protein